jgi:hypothetical protein
MANEPGVLEKIETRILCSVISFFENRAVYEIMWKNIVERGRPQMAIWRMRHCMLDTQSYKYTHSGCVILIVFTTSTISSAPQCYIICALSLFYLFISYVQLFFTYTPPNILDL